jgi:plasmid stabilization system protein ParE
MTTCVLTALAETDLSDIWDYSASQWGEAQAEIYLRERWQTIESLAATHNVVALATRFVLDISNFR